MQIYTLHSSGRGSNKTVTLRLRLQATDPSSGQTKLLMSLNPVDNCILYCRFQASLYYSGVQVRETEQTHYFLRQNDMSSFKINENKTIGQQFDTGRQIDKLLTGQLSRDATNRDFLINSIVKMLCIHCIDFIQKKKIIMVYV